MLFCVLNIQVLGSKIFPYSLFRSVERQRLYGNFAPFKSSYYAVLLSHYSCMYCDRLRAWIAKISHCYNSLVCYLQEMPLNKLHILEETSWGFLHMKLIITVLSAFQHAEHHANRKQSGNNASEGWDF